MTAEKANHGWRWLTCCAHDHSAAAPARKLKFPPRRQHASWVLELALMLVLAMLMPRGKKRE